MKSNPRLIDARLIDARLIDVSPLAIWSGALVIGAGDCLASCWMAPPLWSAVTRYRFGLRRPVAAVLRGATSYGPANLVDGCDRSQTTKALTGSAHSKGVVLTSLPSNHLFEKHSTGALPNCLKLLTP